MKRKQSGFTLLEIIIVIIIVGVLASLALPRFFSMVERTRGAEALNSFTAIRGAMERCYLRNDQDYTGCTLGAIDVDDPGTSAGAHFTYTMENAATKGTWEVTATRNTLDGGDGASTVGITYNVANTKPVDIAGDGPFLGI